MTHSISLMSEKTCSRVSKFVPRTPYWESMSSELDQEMSGISISLQAEIRRSRDVSDICRRWCGVLAISRNWPDLPEMGHVLVCIDRNSFWSCLLILFDLHDIGSKPSPLSAVDDYTCLFVSSVCLFVFLGTLFILPQTLRAMAQGRRGWDEGGGATKMLHFCLFKVFGKYIHFLLWDKVSLIPG